MNVLLIHGLGRTPLSMWGLAHVLRSHHHCPHFFGYWAWKNSYPDIVEQLRSQLMQLSTQGKYCIVTHSLGGILCRSALQQIPEPEHIFMLGPPNQLPRLATIAIKVPVFNWVTQDCGVKLSQPTFYETLPTLEVPYTIFAGDAGPRGNVSPFGNDLNDGIVAVKETYLKAGDRPIIVPTYHTFMMNHPNIQQSIIRTLRGMG